MNNQIEQIAFELEDAVNSISLRVETLENISINFKHLQGDMDQAVFDGRQQFAYDEHHREVHLLAELMYYTMNELKESHKRAKQYSEELLSLREKAE